MPTPNRLPIVNADDGVWGDILRQFLMKEHFNDDTDNAANGGHKTITITAGTTAAGTAPLKFTSGSLMTTPEAGAIEFLSDNLYFTQTTSTTRKTIAAYNDASGATGDVYYRDSGGNFVRLGIGSSNDVLTVSGGIPSWQAPTGGVVSDSVFTIQDNSDNTKQLKFEVSGITTGTTRTLTVPDASTAIVGTDTTQTLTSKTISGADNTLSDIPYSAINVTNTPVFRTTSTVTYNSGTASFAVPSGVTTNDIVVVYLQLEPGGATIGAASGFTEAGSSPVTVGGSVQMRVYWKRATGADAGTYDFTVSSGNRAGIAARYSGVVRSGDPFDATNSNTAGSGTTTPAVSLTSTVDHTLLVWANFNINGYATSVLPSGFSSELYMSNGRQLAEKEQLTAGATGSISGTIATGSPMVTWLGALRPDTAGSLQAALDLKLETDTVATLSNKTLDNTTILTVKDANLTLQDDVDTTKQAKFQLSGITTSTTRTLTLPNANTTLVGTDATQTLTSKTLDDPKIDGTIYDINNKEILDLIPAGAGAVNYLELRNRATASNPSIKATGSDTNVGFDLLTKGTGKVTVLDGTDNSKRVAFDVSTITTSNTRTLTFPNADTTLLGMNTATAKGDLFVATASNTVTRLGVSGNNGWVLTEDSSQAGGVKWAAVAGGSGTFSDTAFTLQDNSDATKQVQFELSGVTTSTTRTLTVPNASTTLVGTDVTQTLTNKTLTAPRINTINDTNGNAIIDLSATSGSTNYLQVLNSNAGSPVIKAAGSSTDINIDIQPKNAGRLTVNGTNVPTINSTDTLTNKTIDGSDNTIINVSGNYVSVTNPILSTTPTVETASTLAVATSSSANISVPSGVAADDIIVVILYLESSTATVTPPAGFTATSGSPASFSNDRIIAYWKRATGADAGTYNFSLSASTYRIASAIRISGCIGSGNPFDVEDADSTSSTSMPTLSMTTTVDNALILWAGSNWNANDITVPSGYT